MKKYIFQVAIIFLGLFFFVSCYQNSSKDNSQAVNKVCRKDSSILKENNKVHDSLLTYLDSIFTIKDSVVFENYKMIVLTTCLGDAIRISENYFSNQHPVVSQQFLFYKSNNLLKKKELPSKWIMQFNIPGKKIKMLNHVIYQIGYLKGEGGGYYAIQGSDGCLSCAESWGLFNVNGKLETFRRENGRIKKVYSNIGNPELVLKRYKIPLEKFYSIDYKTESIDF